MLCFIHHQIKRQVYASGTSLYFLGYPHGQKAYRVLDLVTKSISVSRYVKFYKTIFPLHSSNPKSTFPTIDSYIPTSFDDNSNSTPDDVITSSPTDSLASTSSDPPLIRTTRITRSPAHLQDYICKNTISNSIFSHTITNLCIGLSSSHA